MSFQTIRRRKVHEDVALQIREAIIPGVLPEGSGLPPARDLIAIFAVGPSAIRITPYPIRQAPRRCVPNTLNTSLWNAKDRIRKPDRGIYGSRS